MPGPYGYGPATARRRPWTGPSRMSSGSGTGLSAPGGRAGLQAVGNRLDVVEFSGSDRDHQVVGLVGRQGQPETVESVERDGAGQRQTLVAVDEGLGSGERVQQRRRLLVD